MIASLKLIAPWIVYIVGLFVFLLCISGRVQYGFLLMAPLIPLQNVVEKVQHLPFGKDFNDIVLISMLLGWLVSMGSRKDGFLQKSPLNVVLFLYFIFTYFSLYWGSMSLNEPPPINPFDERVQRWKNYMLLPLLFFLAANNLRTVSDMKKVFFMMCLGMFLMNYYNVQQVQDMTSWISRAKVHGTFVFLGANEVAAFYATYTFVIWGIWLFMPKNKWKGPLLLLLCINWFLFMFMYSRAAYLAVFVAALFFCGHKLKPLLIVLILVPIFWQIVLPKRVVERIQYTEQEGQLDQSAQTRLLLWEQSINYFKESPVFGIGFNVFARLEMQMDTHNLYLRTLAEQGLIGLMFLVMIMLIAFQRSWKLYKSTDEPFLKGLALGFCACVIAVMVGNFFGDRWTHLPLAAHFWIYLGMVESGNNMSKVSSIPKVNASMARIRKGRGL